MDKKGIKISCKKRRNISYCVIYSNDLNLKIYCKTYCAVLSKVILTLKNYIVIKSFLVLKTK